MNDSKSATMSRLLTCLPIFFMLLVSCDDTDTSCQDRPPMASRDGTFITARSGVPYQDLIPTATNASAVEPINTWELNETNLEVVKIGKDFFLSGIPNRAGDYVLEFWVTELGNSQGCELRKVKTYCRLRIILP